MTHYDIIVIGAGPAGLTAGIYGGRQGSSVLMLDKGPAGGLGLEVPMMENYPGFEMIAGMSLVTKMKKQATKVAELREMEEVYRVDLDDVFSVETSREKYTADAVIFATGSKHRQLGVPGENDLLERGVSYCATCDGPLYKDRKVLMVGGGNSAAQEAVFLKNIGCDVSIVHRRDELRADRYLQEKLKEMEIPVIWNSVVKEIRGHDRVEEVVIHNRVTGEDTVLEVDGIFIAIGEKPINQLAVDMGVKVDDAGYIITDKFQRTSIPRVYAAGDITGGLNQWITACAEGAVAATYAYREIQKY